MKFEKFCLRDLSVKGEGNLHIIVLNHQTGHVFRFQKDTAAKPELLNGGDVSQRPQLNIHKIYKVGVNYKKYSVLQKFWGKVFLPKTRAGLMSAKIIEDIAAYIEEMRPEFRRHRSIITQAAHIEIQPDLTKFPLEYKQFIDGFTFCVELKPKFGILFQSSNPSQMDCLSQCSRFCLSQRRRAPAHRTQYCPCDFFSGDPGRMKRSIKELIVNSQDKLRIFQDGHIIPNISETTISNLMMELSSAPDHGTSRFVDQFCNLIIQAVTFNKSESVDLVTLPFKVSSNCGAHPWSAMQEDVRGDIYNGSVLGRLIHTDCLVNNSSKQMKIDYDQLKEFLISNNIESKDDIFDLWNEHLISLDIPDNVRQIIRNLKKYVVSLTIRDCSLMMKFCRTSRDRIQGLNCKDDNSMVLELKEDGSVLLATVDIIDISIKPLSKIHYNFNLEQQLRSMYETQ